MEQEKLKRNMVSADPEINNMLKSMYNQNINNSLKLILILIIIIIIIIFILLL